MKYFTDVLGARLVFAIQSMDTKVAMLELTEGPPLVLLADHLEGERPILIYRVADLREMLSVMEARGWAREETFEIPQGPCCTFVAEGGHRIGVYQLTRPDVGKSFEGRREF